MGVFMQAFYNLLKVSCQALDFLRKQRVLLLQLCQSTFPNPSRRARLQLLLQLRDHRTQCLSDFSARPCRPCRRPQLHHRDPQRLHLRRSRPQRLRRPSPSPSPGLGSRLKIGHRRSKGRDLLDQLRIRRCLNNPPNCGASR